MIVRLKVADKIKANFVKKEFQFYDSPIKRNITDRTPDAFHKFQFYDSPIKR